MNETTKKILHVDDDPQSLRIIDSLLEKHGFTVISIEDPTKALEILIEQEIRVVVLDIDMPHKSGLELLKEIKEYDGGIQVIMLTGVSTMANVLKSLRLGAESCFFKPVTEIEPLIESLDNTFIKIERWWETLRDLSTRKKTLHTTS